MYNMKSMKKNCKIQFKFFGTSSVGERGQVVIPAEARSTCGIKPKDQLIFFGHGRIMHFVKSNEIEGLLNELSENISNNLNKIKNIKKDEYGK